MEASSDPDANYTENVTTPARPFSDGGAIVSAVFLVPMMVFGILANTVTIIVISWSKNLKSVLNLLIISLSVSDLLSALISPLNLYRRTWGFDEWMLPEGFCKLFMAIDIWTSGVTALHILLFSIVRLISMKWPYSYKRIKTIHVKICVAVIWAVTFCAGCIPGWLSYAAGTMRVSYNWPVCTLDPNWVTKFIMYSTITYPILIYIPMFATAVVTFLTVMTMLQRRAERARKSKTSMSASVRKQSDTSKSRIERKENHAMLQLGLIAGSFLFGYIPITSYGFYTTNVRISTLEEAVFDWNYAMTAYILLRISECLNPIFYNVASSKMRQATISLLSKIFGCCYFEPCKRIEDIRSVSSSSINEQTKSMRGETTPTVS